MICARLCVCWCRLAGVLGVYWCLFCVYKSVFISLIMFISVFVGVCWCVFEGWGLLLRFLLVCF